MPNTYFTSDLHFHHRNILKFCPETRGHYANVAEMNQKIIEHWQETVQPDDHVWSLGDMFFCGEDEAISIMDQLPGIKHLIWGNHDKVIKNSHRLLSKFASVDHYRELRFGDTDFMLFHYPIMEYNKMHYGAVHLYGHVHGKNNHPGRAVDVGWDGPIGGKLVTLDAIKAYTQPRPILTHH